MRRRATDLDLPEALAPADPAASPDLNFGLDLVAPVRWRPTGSPHPLPATPVAPASKVADAFAALLAVEQDGMADRPAPSAQASPSDRAARVALASVPHVTDAVVDQIAARVAERLGAGPLGDRLCETMRTTIEDTVRRVVSETSERLVRDEIARIRSGGDAE